MTFSSIKVGPITYAIAPITEPGCLGYLNERETRIEVHRPDDYLTIFHEALHAVDALYGIGLKERQVRALEATIVPLLKDNPDFAKALLGWTS